MLYWHTALLRAWSEAALAMGILDVALVMGHSESTEAEKGIEAWLEAGDLEAKSSDLFRSILDTTTNSSIAIGHADIKSCITYLQ